MNDIKKVKMVKKPVSLTEEKKPTEKLVSAKIYWEAPEFVSYDRGTNWYIALFVIGAGLAGLFWWLDNFFGFAAVILAVIVFFVLSRQKPKKRIYGLNEEGIIINNKIHPFTNYKSFYITFTDNIASLHLEPTKKLAFLASALLVGVDAQKVGEFINQYLPENQKAGVPTNDLFSKWFRF